MKFSEPTDKAIPNKALGDKEWCLFEFRNDLIYNEGKPMLLEGKSSFLIGKQINVCDFIVADESV